MSLQVIKNRSFRCAVVYFANPDNALAYMTELRWPDGVVTCPSCEPEGRSIPSQ